jgi:hypothetical protein
LPIGRMRCAITTVANRAAAIAAFEILARIVLYLCMEIAAGAGRSDSRASKAETPLSARRFVKLCKV